MRNSRKKIWYPGSAYAPQEWINYLTNEINGEWIFSDNTSTEWNWTSRFNYEKLRGCTLELVKDNRFNKNLDTLIISFHPGLRSFEEVKTNIFQFFKPKNVINVMELFDNYNNIQLKEEIPMFETEGYTCEKLVILPKFKRIYCCFELSL